MAFDLDYNFTSQTGADQAAFDWVNPTGTQTGLANRSTNRQWCWSGQTTPSSSGSVGPPAAEVGAGFAYTEMSSTGVNGDVFRADHVAAIDASNNTIEAFVEWGYRGDGSADGSFQWQANEGGGWVDVGPSSPVGPVAPAGDDAGWSWQTPSFSLSGISSATTQLRLVLTHGSDGAAWNKDLSIRRIRIVGTANAVAGIIPYIQSLGATHLFTLSNEGTNVAHDYGNSVDPTQITGGSYSFEPEPVCLGFTHCARSTTSTSEGVDGAIFNNRNDINAANGTGNDSSVFDWNQGTKQIMFWARQLELFNATCMYEQGGGTNNLAFMGGPRVTFQAADAGQPFIIVPDQVLSQKDRAIFHGGGWEYRTQHSGAGNRVWKTANGVIQGYDDQGGTASFPGHSGDIVIGNSSENLKTFNDNTLTSETVAQDSNLLVMINNADSIGDIAEGDFLPSHRETFERTVIAEHVIVGTVAQQQAALDTLSGTVFENVNCAIEIRQATDAVDYTLTLDNIKFVQSQWLRDISVQYVGPHTLTVINTGTSNAVEISTPPEKDLDGGSTIIQGGGSLLLINPATLTLTGIPNGLEVRIKKGTVTMPGGYSSSVSGNAFTFSHGGDGAEVRVSIGGVGDDGKAYERQIFPLTLSAVDQVIPLEFSLNPSYQ